MLSADCVPVTPCGRHSADKRGRGPAPGDACPASAPQVSPAAWPAQGPASAVAQCGCAGPVTLRFPAGGLAQELALEAEKVGDMPPLSRGPFLNPARPRNWT